MGKPLNVVAEEESKLLVDPNKADRAFEAMVGADRYNQAKDAENEAEYEDESDEEIDETSQEVIKIVNVHKTYLLGIEGVPALRGVNLTV